MERAQPGPNGTDFACSSNSSSCSTYIAYFAQEPGFLDLGNISDLFDISRLSIARASNLASEDMQLFPSQLLLVAITCGCSGNQYFANITYEIKKGDSFYYVSTTTFENLTNWQVVEDMNPALDPIKLKVGDKAVFPLFCKCPSRTQLDNQIQYLISYVWQRNDGIQSVSAKFNASASDIIAENKYQNFSLEVGVPVMIPVSNFPVLNQTYPPRRNKSKHPGRKTLIAFTSAACTLFLLILAAVLICTCSIRRRRKALNRNSSFSESADLIQEMEIKKNKNLQPKMTQEKLVIGVSGYLSKPIMYNVKELIEATANFDAEHRIGGSLFRATINGEILAVKRTKDDVSVELKILQKVNHGNLVKLMGMSSEPDGNFFLVYEYAENGSLENWLIQKTSFLSWNQRLNIALDVANGLQYLHEHIQPSIVHGNISTSNILLDASFKAKIANFSMARIGTNSLMPKADVFAFGVVLLELLAGNKGVEGEESGEMEILREDKERKEERLRKWMDPKLEGRFTIESALGFAGLAKACTQEKSLARPSMAEIVFNLSVLAQSSPDQTLEGSSWSLGGEPEELVRMVKTVTAR